MTAVTMIANDTLHISSVKPDNLVKGEEFGVPAFIADDLERRGLARRKPLAKADPPLENKMEPTPENKAPAPIAGRRGR